MSEWLFDSLYKYYIVHYPLSEVYIYMKVPRVVLNSRTNQMLLTKMLIIRVHFTN
jgi:hypothetical protein